MHPLQDLLLLRFQLLVDLDLGFLLLVGEGGQEGGGLKACATDCCLRQLVNLLLLDLVGGLLLQNGDDVRVFQHISQPVLEYLKFLVPVLLIELDGLLSESTGTEYRLRSSMSESLVRFLESYSSSRSRILEAIWFGRSIRVLGVLVVEESPLSVLLSLCI